MKKLALTLVALAITAGTIYGIWLLALSVQKPHAPPVTTEEEAEPSAQVPAAPAETSLPSPSPSPRAETPKAPAAGTPITAPVRLSEESVDQIVKCLPQLKSEASSLHSLNDAWKSISTLEGGESERRELSRNTHILLSNGEKRRIRLTLQEVAGSKGSLAPLLQVFSEDAENLPVPLPIPSGDARNPSSEVVNKYVSMGKVTYRDLSASIRFKSGAAAELQEENGHARLLQLNSPKASIGCAYEAKTGTADCQCLSKP